MQSRTTASSLGDPLIGVWRRIHSLKFCYISATKSSALEDRDLRHRVSLLDWRPHLSPTRKLFRSCRCSVCLHPALCHPARLLSAYLTTNLICVTNPTKFSDQESRATETLDWSCRSNPWAWVELILCVRRCMHYAIFAPCIPISPQPS
jgi:hypothetical protein